MSKTQIVRATEGLKGHPGLADIFVLLCSGWSVSRVATVVTKRFGVLTTADAVEEYLEAIPEEALFNATALARPSFYESVVNELGAVPVHPSDLVIDTRGEATQTLLLMRERIDAMRLAEASAKPSRLLTDAIKVYFTMLGLYEDRYLRKRDVNDTELATEPVVTLKDMLDERESTVPGETTSALQSGGNGDSRPARAQHRLQLQAGTS